MQTELEPSAKLQTRAHLHDNWQWCIGLGWRRKDLWCHNKMISFILSFLDAPPHLYKTWCKLTRRLGFTHEFCIKSHLIFKISSSEGKYFQLLCLYMRNQPFFRFAPHFWCRNQGRKIRNLGKNGLFDGQFLHKSKREITVSSQNRFFCILKKISFF